MWCKYLLKIWCIANRSLQSDNYHHLRELSSKLAIRIGALCIFIVFWKFPLKSGGFTPEPAGNMNFIWIFEKMHFLWQFFNFFSIFPAPEAAAPSPAPILGPQRSEPTYLLPPQRKNSAYPDVGVLINPRLSPRTLPADVHAGRSLKSECATPFYFSDLSKQAVYYMGSGIGFASLNGVIEEVFFWRSHQTR